MLKIGEFSKLSRISVRMLRHYDEIGLLKPAQTDPFTAYRSYSAEQLPSAWRITALKDMGFSLAEIGRILPFLTDADKLAACLDERRAELIREKTEIENRIRLLDAARNGLRKEESMQYTVNLKIIPAAYAATVRMTIDNYEEEGKAWEILNRETEPLHLVPDNPCLCAALFWDDEYKEQDVDVEVLKTVKGTYPDTEHVRFRQLPAVQVASCVFKGSYEQCPEVYGAVIVWIQANGYVSDGPMFNIYHVSPHETNDPEAFVTEVCYPVKRA